MESSNFNPPSEKCLKSAILVLKIPCIGYTCVNFCTSIALLSYTFKQPPTFDHECSLTVRALLQPRHFSSIIIPLIHHRSLYSSLKLSSTSSPLHMFCSLYDHEPCQAIAFCKVLEGELFVLDVLLDASKKRNHLFRTYVRAEHGILGRGVCVAIPDCVVAFIRTLVPSPNNVYTGHTDIDTEE